MKHNKSKSVRKFNNLLVSLLVLIVLLSTSAVADVGTGEAVEGIAATGEVLTNGDVQAIQSITFQKDTRIRDALRFLSAKYKKNIVPSPNVDGVLAFTSLYDVTFDDAMEAILGMNLKYEKKGDLIKVYTKEEYKRMMEDTDRMETRTYELYYTSAAEAVKLLTPIMSSSGRVTGSTPSVKLFPTGESISSGTGGGDDMALNERIVIVDYPEVLQEVESLLDGLDKRPKQVLIEATILSAKITEGMDLGVDLNFAAGASISGISAVSAGTAGTPMETTGFAEAGDGLRVGITSGDFSAFITALEETTDVTIMANPKILAVNKQLGQVYIGTKLGYREGDTIGDGGVTSEGQVKFLDTGTKLSFRPYIGDDGYIRMDIHPKDSSGSLNNEGVPDETSTELATNIMVKDGQTVAIGGLFRDQVTATKSQVPILGDIPILGELFKSTSDETIRQEVIVLLTPHIIDEPEEIDGHARIDDIQRKKYGSDDELHWLNRGKLIDDYYAEATKYYVDGEKELALAKLDKVLILRPAHLEAIRLKERILEETDSEKFSELERIVNTEVEQQDTDEWFRR